MASSWPFSLPPGNVPDPSPVPVNATEACPGAPFLGWMYMAQPIYIVLICAVGMVGNAFVLLVLVLHRVSCTVAEIYLGNLAAADLLFVGCLPFWAANIVNGYNWPFGEFLCKSVSAVIYMNLFCSVYLLAMVSIDRYLALVHTMTSGRTRSPACAKMTCLAIWAFGFLMSTPVILFRTVMAKPEYNISACLLRYPSEGWSLNLEILLLVFAFIVPGSIITFCSCQILQVLRNNTMRQFMQVRKETKSSKLVLLVLLMFFLCWLPFHFFTFLSILQKLGLIPGCRWEAVLENGNQITTFLGFTNNCINPLLYVIVGKHFRKKAKEVFERSAARKRRKLNLASSASSARTSIITLRNRV
uniref:B2 bradykinin receptor n=1 Tax=Callorhinchus milii TaxID=7868 RepID=A0A4W3I2C5_CALMI